MNFPQFLNCFSFYHLSSLSLRKLKQWTQFDSCLLQDKYILNIIFCIWSKFWKGFALISVPGLLCAPPQKPGLFCKAAEPICSHTEPVGGSPSGHCWPWLSSQRPGGDWQDPLQKLPQGPGWAGVWLQSHRGGQSVWNRQTNRREDRGLCSWVYGLREKRPQVQTDKHVSVHVHGQWWTTHCGSPLEGPEVVGE